MPPPLPDPGVVPDPAAQRALDEIRTTFPIGTQHIQNDAITFAKMQNISSPRLIGKSSGVAGDPEQIALGTGLAFSGSTLNLSVVNSNLNLTPQFDSAGTTSLAVTATSSATAQDTGLTLTAAADGDYMIWATCSMQNGAAGRTHAELRINGTAVQQVDLLESVNVVRSSLPIVWYATGVTSGHVIKITTFRTTADGVFLGQLSSLMIQQVGP